MEAAHKYNPLVEGPVAPTLFRFALPFMLSSLLQSLYGAADLFVVGQYSGAAAVSGVSIGSLFIGGMIAAVSISAGMELFIIISAFVFLFEALSVIIQVSVYKKTKKRVFKMAPVHHHFEMCGWKETKVVAVFSLITAALCAISYFAL